MSKMYETDLITLGALAEFFQNLDGGWDEKELFNDMIEETKLLRNKEMGDVTLSLDECEVVWGEENEFVCVLDELIEKYSKVFLNNVLNVLKSFEGNKIYLDAQLKEHYIDLMNKL